MCSPPIDKSKRRCSCRGGLQVTSHEKTPFTDCKGGGLMWQWNGWVYGSACPWALSKFRAKKKGENHLFCVVSGIFLSVSFPPLET